MRFRLLSHVRGVNGEIEILSSRELDKLGCVAIRLIVEDPDRPETGHRKATTLLIPAGHVGLLIDCLYEHKPNEHETSEPDSIEGMR